MAAGKAEPATRSPAIRRTRDAPLPPLAGLAHAYPNATSPDLASAVLSIAGLGLLVWSLIEAPARGRTSALVLAAGIGGLAVLAVFAWWERRSAHPMLNMDLFRKRELSGAVTSQALAVFGFYGALFLLTQFLQFSLGYSALRAGVCSALEVKSYLGSPGILDLPGGGCGRLESWRKWSFPAGLPGHGGAGPPGWAVAGKSRRGSWFPLASRPDLSQVWPLAVVAGCMAELTEVWVRGEAWWSAGFEATGPCACCAAPLSTPPTWYSPRRCRPGCNSAWATPSPARAGWASGQPSCRGHNSDLKPPLLTRPGVPS